MTRPNRLPQGVTDRQLRTAITRGDTSSAGGRDGFSRPVVRTPPGNRPSQTPATALDRLWVRYVIDTSALTPTGGEGHSISGLPTTTVESVGSSIAVDADTHHIDVTDAGVYAVNLSLTAAGIDAVTDTSCYLMGQVQIALPPHGVNLCCLLRAGDPEGGPLTEGVTGINYYASASNTYHYDGIGFGVFSAGYCYQHVDGALIPQIVLDLQVQQIVRFG